MRKKKKVLLVDDDEFDAADLGALLRIELGSGYPVTVCTATSVAAGKRQMDLERPDLVIIDVKLPPGDDESALETKGGHESGLVLARWMKDRYPRVRIIGLSGKDSPRVASWFETHCDGFFAKPVMPERIIRRVQSLLNPRTAHWPRTFIVHGHDEITKLQLKNYLQNTLHFPEPIILHEQKSIGHTVIEKFEAESDNVDIVFVLLTPDDRLADSDATDVEKRRARQNVIFEMGYFLGKFRRKSGRVLLLYKGPLELPSDISGVVYIDISAGVEAAGEAIRREIGGDR